MTQVDIVSGFLGAGKTFFINRMLESQGPENEKIVVLQYESGEENLQAKENMHVEKASKEQLADPAHLKEIIDGHMPDRLIIEHNGVSSVSDLLSALDADSLKKSCCVRRVIHMIDASTFDIFMANMSSILTEQIANSDVAVINRIGDRENPAVEKISRRLKTINRSMDVAVLSAGADAAPAAEMGKILGEARAPKSTYVFYGALIASAIIFLSFHFLARMGFQAASALLPHVLKFSTVWMSILLQAFPFVLIGALASALIQVLVPRDKITALFADGGSRALIPAVLIGLIFPVCDCAIVPVARRLLKSGVPQSVVVTFLLAAPIVNPLVIASTLYAFPEQHFAAYARIFLGIVIALTVGGIFRAFPVKNLALRQGADSLPCACGFCDQSSRPDGASKKIRAVIRHTGTEFFSVGGFLTLGAFLSGILQVFVPKNILVGIGGGEAVSLLLMMVSAFVLSVCATSDAFIARSFMGHFSIESIMGFLILGPMMDIKNLLMLSGSFEKKFVLRLVTAVFIISFLLIYLFTSIFF